mmetsp:Transcript_16166/g.27540  ORF Transcript_16166/g.27540 Transcript_16166/m.27540 type:complete len:217 (+) Transcript_16166:114-764(+)
MPCALFSEGSMRLLVGQWVADVARAKAATDSGGLSGDAAVKMAVRLIEDGCVRQAMPYVEGSGLGDLELPEIQEQLRRKHPQERREWAMNGVAQAPRLFLRTIRDAIKNLRRNAGVGANKFRNEYLLVLMRGEMAPTTRLAVLDAWKLFAELVMNNDLPSWFYMVWTTVVQFAPVKEEGLAPALHKVRPIGCGGCCERRAIGRAALGEKREALCLH